jgi:methylase of polypeptide subunit release factors
MVVAKATQQESIMNEYDIVLQLTSRDLSDLERSRMLNDFAYGLGWQPSDRFGGLGVSDLARAHLVVEHGLQNTAVITFLREPRTYAELDRGARRRLLAISYNNLVDWHIHVAADRVAFVFNLLDPPEPVETCRLSAATVEVLRSQAFERIVGMRPHPQCLALDAALIETVSRWKRLLAAHMGYAVPNESLSALFNAIILARTAEDYYRQSAAATGGEDAARRALIERWENGSSTVGDALSSTIQQFMRGPVPSFLLDESKLRVFDDLDRDTLFSLFLDFYRNRHAPYDYDFSLMSKHALSRIYEHYVSLLRVEESPQAALPLLPSLPEEEFSKVRGSIYTPQFIARFFARYLREQLPPRSFRDAAAIDPACGSGIFLRTLLEMQCDPAWDGLTTQSIDTAFSNVVGVDFDENACEATRLSLALLYFAMTGDLPSRLNIMAEDAIERYTEHPEVRSAFDVVMANPPFLASGTQTREMRHRLAEFMDGYASGRVDAYLAFLRIGLEMLKPGGYGLFVLPHSFLLARNAAGLRELISRTTWVRCLADLSAIRVFPGRGSYVILLIFQKLPDVIGTAPRATVLKCQDLVGRALQDLVENRRAKTSFYSIYEVSQDIFSAEEWSILPESEAALREKLSRFPPMEEFLEAREGFISGADDVFILPAERLPGGEERIFAPLLADREMQPYTVPDQPSRYFFYPYLEGERVEEELLRGAFPRTWEYLRSHRRTLVSRPSIEGGRLEWWRPVRPRPPQHMMRPKIVAPHLAIVPRFSLDAEGRYAVSRSPLLYPKGNAPEHDLLRFFLAVLNSTPCFWYIATHSHVYERGYLMLEPKSLRPTPVPDPSRVPPVQLRRILRLVDERLRESGPVTVQLEKELDTLVADLYGLSSEERQVLGMEG